jgi:cytochrome c oxidase subunit IV
MEHPVVPIKTYLLVYVALLAIFAATMVIAFIDLSQLIQILAAVTLAFLKAGLVVMFFMHVRYSDQLVRLFVFAGLVWLLILIGLTFTDYLSRTGLFFLNP